MDEAGELKHYINLEDMAVCPLGCGQRVKSIDYRQHVGKKHKGIVADATGKVDCGYGCLHEAWPTKHNLARHLVQHHWPIIELIVGCACGKAHIRLDACKLSKKDHLKVYRAPHPK